MEEGGWNEPAGFHLIPLPFADDMRAAPDQVLNSARGTFDSPPFPRCDGR